MDTSRTAVWKNSSISGMTRFSSSGTGIISLTEDRTDISHEAAVHGVSHGATRWVLERTSGQRPRLRSGQDPDCSASYQECPAISDGGTLQVHIIDAVGKEFIIFIDYRMESPTPGAIYLDAYPGERNSIRVLDEQGFKQKVGDFGYH